MIKKSNYFNFFQRIGDGESPIKLFSEGSFGAEGFFQSGCFCIKKGGTAEVKPFVPYMGWIGFFCVKKQRINLGG